MSLLPQVYSKKNSKSKGGCKFVFLIPSVSFLLAFSALFFLCLCCFASQRQKIAHEVRCVFIYIYIYAVMLLSGPSLGVFGSYYLVQVGFLDVIIWSKFVFLAYKNSGFKRFVLHTQLSFCVFFLSPIFWQFSKNSLFQKQRCKNWVFQFFSVLSLNFENSLFLGLLKHYKNRGFSKILCFVLLKEKKTGKKKMITGIYEFGFFWSKNGRFVTHICFSKKKAPETPIFIVFFGCALFGPSCQKREILDTRPKKKKIFTDN